MAGGISELITVINQLNADAQQNGSAEATFELTSGTYSVEATTGSYVLPDLEAGTSLHIIGNGSVIQPTQVGANEFDPFMLTRGHVIIEDLTFQNWTVTILKLLTDPNDDQTKLTRFINCIFKDNTSTQIGTAFGVSSQNHHLEVINCEFIDNSNSWLGGAFYVYGKSVLIEDSLFQGNSAEHGGAMQVNVAEETIIKNCEFIQNISEDGAIRHYGKLIVDSSHFEANEGTFYGGAISSGLLDVKHSVFKNNTAKYQGGALYISASLPDNKVSIQNCIFENNDATDFGSAIYVYTGSESVVCNYNEFIGNFTTTGSEKPIIHANIQHSDFRNNYWNADDGPEEEGASNTGSGELVPNGLNFVPWLTKKVSPHDGEIVYPFVYAANDSLTTTNLISLQEGEKRLYETDLNLGVEAGEMSFTRLYRQNHQADFQFMGLGWYHNHHIYLDIISSTTIKAYMPGVIVELVDGSGNGEFSADGSASTITSPQTDQYLLKNSDGSIYRFEVLDSSQSNIAQLTEIEYPSTQKWLYAYDANFRLEHVEDRHNRGLLFTYYPSGDFREGLLSTVRYKHDLLRAGISLDYTDDGSGQALLTSVTDARGEAWTYEYYTDATWKNYLHRRLAPAIGLSLPIVLEELAYEGSKLIIDKITQKNGNSEVTEIIDYDYLNLTGVEVTHYIEDKPEISKTYTFEHGFCRSIEDGKQNNFNFGLRNPFMHHTATIDARGNITDYMWNAPQELDFISVPRQVEGESKKVVTDYFYDSEKRTTAIEDGNGDYTRFFYTNLDRQPNKIERTNATSSITYSEVDFIYDSEGRLEERQVINPNDGLASQIVGYGYDSAGLLQQMTVEDLSGEGLTVVTNFDYDSLGRVIKTSKTSMYGTCEYTYMVYDAGGLLLGQACGVHNAPSAITTRQDLDTLYDASDIKKQYTRITKFEYDELGRQIIVRRNCHTVATERVTRTVYDDLNRVIMTIENYDDTANPEDWQWVANHWQDNLGGQINHGNENDMNIITKIAYNSRSLPRWQQDRQGQVNLFGYDEADRLVKTVGNASNPSYNNDYDGDWELKAYNASLLADQDLILEQAYDANGNVTDIKRWDTVTSFQESKIIYDEANQPIRIIENLSTKAEHASAIDYNVVTENWYDPIGQVVEERQQMDDNTWFRTRYVYDPLGRTTAVIVNYQGDDISSLLSNGSTATDQNLISQFLYDEQGNLIESIAPDTTRTRYVYNGVNQVIMRIQNYTMSSDYNWTWSGSVWQVGGSDVEHGDLNDENIVTQYEYETDNTALNHGRLASQTLVNGIVQRMVYDIAGRNFMQIANYLEGATQPENWVWNAGNEQWESDPNTAVNRGANVDVNLIQQFSYDNEDRVVQMRDHLGNLNHVVYDKLGRQIKVIRNYEAQNNSDPSTWYPGTSQWLDGGGQAINHGNDQDQNQIVALHYSLQGVMDQVWDSQARQTVFIHDARGLVSEQIENYQNGGLGETSGAVDNFDQNIRTQFYYDKLGRLLLARDPEGKVITYGYDKRNRVVTVKRVGDGVTYVQETTYDKLGNVEKVSDSRSGSNYKDAQVEYVYDGVFRPIMTRDGVGTVTLMTYNRMGSVIQMTEVTKSVNYTTLYLYDALQRRYRVIQNYDGTANPENWKWRGDPLLRWEDGNGNAINHGNQDMNIIVHLDFDINGDVVEVHAPAGDHSLHGYDKLHRQVTTQNVADHLWSSIYQASNRKMQRLMTYPGVNNNSPYTITEEADRLGRPRSVQYGDPANTADVRFSFDIMGNAKLMQEYAGANFTNIQRQTRTSYDGMNRPILMEFDNDGDSTYEENIAYAYSRNGQRTRMSLAEGHETYSFDDANNLSRLTDRFGERNVVSDYNALGYPRMVQRLSEEGLVLDTAYQYDQAGRLTVVRHGSNQEPARRLADYRYSYDARGNRISAQEATATVVVSDTLTNVDSEVNTVEGDWEDNGSGGIYSDDLDAKMTIDIPGATTQVRLTYGLGLTHGYLGIAVNGVPYRQRYTYSSNKTISTMVINLIPQVADHRLTLFNVGENSQRPRVEFIQLQVLGLTAIKNTKTYTYDALSRLKSADGQSFAYDLAGNLVDMNGTSRVFNALNQMTNDGSGVLQYDANGNLTVDSVGNSYVWDRANRLIAYNNDTYAYDGQGNRRQMSEQINGQTRRTDFLVDLLAQYPSVQRETVQVAGITQASQTRHYIHGVNGIHTQYQNGLANYMLQDGLGSLRMQTNTLAMPLYTADYSPYGLGTFPGFGFTGEYSDPNGLLYLRARYYDPAQGTFLSRDSYSGTMGRPMTANRYAYANGNPINYRDPSGHFVISGSLLLGLAASAIIGGVVGAGVDAGIQYMTTGKVNLGQVGVAALEGAVLGLIGGGIGASISTIIAKQAVVSGATRAGLYALGFGIEAAIGTAWDMRVRGDNLGTALVSNVAFAGAFEAVNAVGSRLIRNALRGADIDINAPRSNQGRRASCSFSADTLVQTPDGEKNISDISAGDAIMGSYVNGSDVESGIFTVTATHKQHHETTLDLTINGEVVHTTDEHPFLVKDGEEYHWVEAGNLNIGDTVVSSNGSLGEVEAVTVIDEPQTMYNLTVDLVATYLVGEGQWVVHNSDLSNVELCNIALGVKHHPQTRENVLRPFARAVDAIDFEEWRPRGLYTPDEMVVPNSTLFGSQFHYVTNNILSGDFRIKFNLQWVDSWGTRRFDLNQALLPEAHYNNINIGYTEWELLQVLHNPRYYQATDFFDGFQMLRPQDIGPYDVAFRGIFNR